MLAFSFLVLPAACPVISPCVLPEPERDVEPQAGASWGPTFQQCVLQKASAWPASLDPRMTVSKFVRVVSTLSLSGPVRPSQPGRHVPTTGRGPGSPL